MRKLMIADVSQPYAEALAQVLENEFEVQLCHDGETALELLLSFQPDILIINPSLPFKDGFTVLQESRHRPQIILANCTYVNAYIEQIAANLGVQYIMIMPTVESLRVRLMDLIANTVAPKEDLSAQVVVHLHILNFFTHLDGYHQLCVGIPMFAQNPHMGLSKELYPAIARHFGLPDARTVEHSIRKAISTAWEQKNPLIWAKYFPPAPNGSILCPTNKQFLSRVAQMLEL